MTEVAALLAAFLEATGRDAAIWERREGAVAPLLLGASSESFARRTEAGALAWDVATWARGQALHAQLVTTGDSVGWLFVQPGHAVDADRLLGRLVPVIRRLTRERDGATRELAERYEEINLLYAIGELLGGTTSVESVADTLLGELAATVGAKRAVFLQTNRALGTLEPIATLGLGDAEYPTVSMERLDHVAVRAFRAGSACTEDGGAGVEADPVLAGRGAPLLAVAVSTQIGTAMHNATLVRAAVERRQLVREMQLAHELQLKLLPSPTVVRPEARAASRVVPAESVGGDFFLLARLDRDCTGVLIGDVSGHGYQSALVMALALSAAGIHMQAAFDPSMALEAVQRSLREELMSTEMSISLCYAVIDSRAGELRFANAGHPHAFRVTAAGECTRLPAVAPPIGFSEEPIEECVMRWHAGDRLVFFTDGVVDARDAGDQRLTEPAVLATLAAMTHGETPTEILEAVFAQLDTHVARTPLRDDCTVVVVDRP